MKSLHYILYITLFWIFTSSCEKEKTEIPPNFSGGQPNLPIANFSVSNRTVEVGSEVTFYPKDSNSITKWIWDFDDGSTLIRNNDSSFKHMYKNLGRYAVRLIVENNYGSDTLINNNFITVIKTNTTLGSLNNDTVLTSFNIDYTKPIDSIVSSLNSPVFLDLDKDGIDDIKFYILKELKASRGSAGNIYSYFNTVEGIQPNTFVSQIDDYPYFPCPSPPININSNWVYDQYKGASSQVILMDDICYPCPVQPIRGYLMECPDGFIKVLLVKGKSKKYGWIRVSASSSSPRKAHIVDYAINNNLNQPINLGQKN